MDLEQLRKEILEYAREAGITSQRGIAGKANVANVTVIDVFKHNQQPSVNWVKKVAAALNGPTNRWLRLAGHEFVPYEEPKSQPLPVETVDQIINRIREESKDKPGFTEEGLEIVRNAIIKATQPKDKEQDK